MERFTERLENGDAIAVIATYGEPPYPMVTKDFVNRLAEYEDLEEDGRLIRLPCKIGDIIYRVVWKKYDIDGLGNGMQEDWEIVSERFRIYMLESIGKNVFLSMEEAENCLLRKREGRAALNESNQSRKILFRVLQ